MKHFDVKILNAISTIDQTPVKLSNFEFDNCVELAERIKNQRFENRPFKTILRHTCGGMAVQKLVCETLGSLCIPGNTQAVNSFDEWQDKIQLGGDCKLVSDIMKNSVLEIKSKEVLDITQECTTLFKDERLMNRLLDIANKDSVHYAPYVLACKKQTQDILNYTVTASVLFRTHNLRNYVTDYNGQWHMKNAVMHRQGLLIYFDRYCENNDENGDYHSDVPHGKNGGKYVMKRYNYTEPPVDLENVFAAE